MNNPLDALLQGLTKKATTVATPDHIVDLAYRAMRMHNPRGGQSEIFRILHVVLGQEKAAIVRAFSKHIPGFRPQAVYNTLREVNFPSHLWAPLRETYHWVPGKLQELEETLAKEAEEAKAKAEAAKAEQEDSNEG